HDPVGQADEGDVAEQLTIGCSPCDPHVQYNEQNGAVRQIERVGVWSERMADTAADVVSLIAGSLRRERARSGLSLTELARRAGIAKSTLSQLEAGAGNPSVGTLWGLGGGVGGPVSRPGEPPGASRGGLPAGGGRVGHCGQSGGTGAMLSSGPPGTRRDIYRLSSEPGAPRLAQPHMAGTIEHLVLGTGRMLAGPVDDPVELAPGDYVRYPGDVPHIFRALE